jgi:glycosyltransferase involved in cell wall biosynthesis
MNVAVCVPVYNDWPSVLVLLARIDAVASSLGVRMDVVLIDDGSSEPPLEVLDAAPNSLGRVSILRLRRNLGHQRAIAIGLTHLYVAASHDVVVVMDGDGEDRPEDVPRLLERCLEKDRLPIVFAQRAKRSGSLSFRLGYAVYKLLHRVLVGSKVEVGNFSAVPRSALARLVSVGETWNHYAAAVYHARIPTELVPIARARRIAGESKMNLTALVSHGLSAISVFSDVVGVRVLTMVAFAILAALVGVIAVVAVRFATDLAIPGWATNAAGILVVSLLSLTLISMLMALFTLRSRSEYGFLPLRDYEHFVLDERILYERRR